MLLSHLKRLCTLLPTLISASASGSAHPTPSAPTSLPSPFQRAVPACAQPCLQAALFKRFPLVCTAPFNLGCLCSRYSFSGESLGEVALGCIYASCSTVDSKAASAYNICLGQEDAVPQTLTALTVTAGSSIKSQFMATPTSVTTTKPTSTLLSSHSTQPSTFRSVVVNSVSLTPSSTPSEAAATAAAAASSPPTMKPAQIAGLSVAAAATFIVAISLMALSVFLRKRRERRGLVEVHEEKTKTFPPDAYVATFPTGFPSAPSPRIPPKRFPLNPPPRRQDNFPYPNPYPGQAALNTRDPAASSAPNPPRKDATKRSSVHTHVRPPALQSRKSPNLPLPPDQIGLALSDEVPDKIAATTATTTTRPQFPRKAEVREHRPKSLHFTSDNSLRPDSVLTQDTVFEEDVLASRRRSSKLLPSPPIPIPPIRTFQPSRPPPAFKPAVRPAQADANRTRGPQPPGLSLNIPVRHSKSLAQVAPPKPIAHPGTAAQLAPPIQMLSVHDPQLSRATSTSSSDVENAGDIPDYYFTAHRSSPQTSTPGPSHFRRLPQGSPRVVKIRPKASSSTVSRATSRASTNIRDSVSSQTSFESVDSNDPTPEDEVEGNQLAEDNKLSPVAESPISMLRYPKVPRASNQLVPRSPRSPRSPQSAQGQQSPTRLLEPSNLLVKRRGEKGALGPEDRLRIESPRRTEVGKQNNNHRRPARSNSTEPWDRDTSHRSGGRHARAQSGQLPRSPAMYDPDTVQPLNIRPKQQHHQHQHQQQAPPDYDALKSPAWVPNLTPRREGEDLFLSVSYSKPAH